MSGTLTHSPADVIAQLIVDLGLGTFTAGSNWQTCVGLEPEDPDKVITVYDTAGSLQGSFQTSGEQQEFYGVQVRLRDSLPNTGWTKIDTIAKTLDAQKQVVVTVSSTGYTVWSVNRVGSVIHLGKETTSSRRDIFVFNASASIKQN